MTEQRFAGASLKPRVITGVIMASVLVAAWNIGILAVFPLVLVVTALAQWEFYSMFLPGAANIPAKLLGVALGAVFISVMFANALPIVPSLTPTWSLRLAVLALALYWLLRWNAEHAIARLRQCAVLLAGLVYIPLLFGPLLLLSYPEQFLVFAVPALSDIAAYFAGVRFGKHKIWPSVSPKKSMEGAVAGLVAAMLVSMAVGLAAGKASLAAFAALGLFLGVMSQLGDFFESALKRTADVKDSGNLLPGHGGVLDRIDSIIFSCGAYALVATLGSLFV